MYHRCHSLLFVKNKKVFFSHFPDLFSAIFLNLPNNQTFKESYSAHSIGGLGFKQLMQSSLFSSVLFFFITSIFTTMDPFSNLFPTPAAFIGLKAYINVTLHHSMHRCQRQIPNCTLKCFDCTK